MPKMTGPIRNRSHPRTPPSQLGSLFSMRFFSQSFLYECVSSPLTLRCKPETLQRSLANRVPRVFPALSQPLCLTCHLLRCDLARVHPLWFSLNHAHHSQDGNTTKMGTKGHRISLRKLDPRRERSGPTREGGALSHPES